MRSLTIPTMLQADVKFEPVPDYDGSDTGLVKVILGPALAGQGWVKLPKDIFSKEFLDKLNWPLALELIHRDHLDGR